MNEQRVREIVRDELKKEREPITNIVAEGIAGNIKRYLDEAPIVDLGGRNAYELAEPMKPYNASTEFD